MSSIVWVTQETENDFRDAERWGEVRFLTVKDLNNNKNSWHNDELTRSLRAQIQKFNPEEDWVVVAGSPYVSAATFMLIGMRGINRVQILRWDNRDRRYIPMYINLRVTKEIDNVVGR